MRRATGLQLFGLQFLNERAPDAAQRAAIFGGVVRC
jgi:hypothetical protein